VVSCACYFVCGPALAAHGRSCFSNAVTACNLNTTQLEINIGMSEK
jgi:hypothetical protein